MTEFSMQPPALACNLLALSPDQREAHQVETRYLFERVQEIQALPDGYAFRLPDEAGIVIKAAQFINLERLCCPFFHFGLEVEPGGEAVWLKLSGPEGVKQFIQSEFGLS